VTGLLLDTNALSAMRRVDRDPVFASWLAAQQSEQLHICAITELELEHGVLVKERSDPAQGAVLRAWLTGVQAEFQHRTLPFDAACARVAARIWLLRSRGYSDLLIAATAQANDMGVVTRNVRDFDDIPGLAVINPWRPRPGLPHE